MNRKVFVAIGLALMLTACADVVPVTAPEGMSVPGFWYGLWHGLIAPIAFFVSLFDNDVAVYSVVNSGGWYDFGFLLGVGSFTASVEHARG